MFGLTGFIQLIQSMLKYPGMLASQKKGPFRVAAPFSGNPTYRDISTYFVNVIFSFNDSQGHPAYQLQSQLYHHRRQHLADDSRTPRDPIGPIWSLRGHHDVTTSLELAQYAKLTFAALDCVVGTVQSRPGIIGQILDLFFQPPFFVYYRQEIRGTMKI